MLGTVSWAKPLIEFSAHSKCMIPGRRMNVFNGFDGSDQETVSSSPSQVPCQIKTE